MNELAVTDEHSRVSDVIGRAAKKQKIPGPQMLSINRNHSAPGSLQVRIARHINAPASHQHLREP